MAIRPHVALSAVFVAGMLAGGAITALLPPLVPEATARGDVAVMTAHNPRTPPAGAYRAEVLGVIDGDTVEARVHVWLGQDIVTRVRLKDIDAPEIAGACGPERDTAIAARDRLKALVSGSSIVLADVRPDKYFGRVVARIVLADGQDAGRILLADGLVRPYRGGRRASWCPIAR